MTALADGALDAPPEPSTAPAASTPAREDHIAERRRSLLDATISVIGRDGLTGLTMKAVADAAGCSYGVAAFHFRSKEGLLLAALQQLLDDYDRVRDERSETGDTGGARAAHRLRVMIDTDFDPGVTSARQMAVWLAFWAESARNPAYRESCAEAKLRYRASTARDLAALARAQDRVIDAEQASTTLNAIIDGYWIANIICGNADAEGCAAGRAASLAYLDALFPGCFPQSAGPTTTRLTE